MPIRFFGNRHIVALQFADAGFQNHFECCQNHFEHCQTRFECCQNHFECCQTHFERCQTHSERCQTQKLIANVVLRTSVKKSLCSLLSLRDNKSTKWSMIAKWLLEMWWQSDYVRYFVCNQAAFTDLNSKKTCVPLLFSSFIIPPNCWVRRDIS